MTKPQIDLLKRLIEADRDYRTKVANRELVDHLLRGVEIGPLYGADARTAKSLINDGLAEAVNPYQNPEITLLFLGSTNPYDFEE